jgi:hydrogenase maturation protease
MKPRVLVAGIGNIFLGDDAFGVEVARELQHRPRPANVRVADFGIRGLDLMYALLDGYEGAIFVDATARGGEPGTLYVIEPELELDAPGQEDHSELSMEGHNLDPVRVLRLAAAMGSRVRQLFVVGCEPSPMSDFEEMAAGLSQPVRNAVGAAVPLVESLVNRLLAAPSGDSLAEKEDASWRN